MEHRRKLLIATGIFSASAWLAAGCAPPRRGVDDPGLPTEATPAPEGPTVSAVRPARPPEVPPPISGGTLLVARDGVTAVAADPDRDRVWIVDLAARRLRAQIVLQPGDEPGRLVEDGAGRVHVALRAGGALVTIDPRSGQVLGRRTICLAPRGVAYDPGGDLLHVACAEGTLATLRAADLAPVRERRLEYDLRDVVVQGGRLFVSKFRAAQLLEVTEAGVAQRQRPPAFSDGSGTIEASVAWRLLAVPGGVAMLHQRASGKPLVVTQANGYYVPASPCQTGLVQGTVTVFPGGGAPVSAPPQIPRAVLPVDAAVSSGGQIAIVAASNNAAAGQPQVLVMPLSDFQGSGTCATLSAATSLPLSSAIAVAFDGSGRIVVQNREPAALYVLPDTAPIPLPGESRASVGHALFHGATANTIACASCHPEAGDDGRAWPFEPIGLRRTQTIRGGLLGTEPFHWDGDVATFAHLANEVFTRRMGGGSLPADQAALLGGWLDAQPALPPVLAAGPLSIERGRRLFQDAQVGCASCHSGARLTNNQSVNVGTGAAFQVPSLVGVAARAPYLHNGCAPTLRDRFGGCGGGDQHGRTSQLSDGQLGDLVSYLESL